MANMAFVKLQNAGCNKLQCQRCGRQSTLCRKMQYNIEIYSGIARFSLR